MKAAIVITLVAVCFAVTAQAQGTWSGWSECSQLCGTGYQTRTCTSAPTTACTGASIDICNTETCQNCTVTGFWWASGCSKTCGGGTFWMARQIITPPSLGGTACPQLNYTYPCNTEMCLTTINGYGFWFWGPFSGPGPLTFTIREIDYPLDAFLFDQDNFVQYQYDEQRPTPFQTNYHSLVSVLNIDTVKTQGPISLDPNTQYYLVVDNSYIGATAGTTNNAGQTVFTPVRFEYAITGLDPGTGYQSSIVYTSAATHTGITIVSLAAIVAAFAALL